MRKINKKDIIKALDIVHKDLQKLGIDDSISVKIKSLKNPHWVALYRSTSQFNSRPIIWINEKFKEIVVDIEKSFDGTIPEDIESVSFKHLIHSIIHEYGHVIAEYLRYRKSKLYNEMLKIFNTEENFAEEFIDYVTYKMDNRFTKYIKAFTNDLKLINEGE